MKYRNLFALLMVIIVFGLSSCEKCIPDCDLIPAKILRYDCDRVIFQLLTSKPIGDPEWIDVQSGKRYSNVLSYYNNCKIGILTNCENITLYVKLKELDNNPVLDDCIRCQAISQDPPQTKVDFSTISKFSCEVAHHNEGS